MSIKYSHISLLALQWRSSKVFYYLIVFTVLLTPGSFSFSQFVPFSFWNQSPIKISILDETTTEGNDLIFTVILSRKSNSAISIDYTTNDNTASAGTHYTFKSGTLNIPANTTSATILVNTADIPSVCQNDVSMYMNLSNPSRGNLIDDQGIGTIQDNDVPELSVVAGGDVIEGGVTTAVASLSVACTTKVVSFFASTSGGTATPGSDYTSLTNSSLSIAAGDLSVNIPVTTLQDTTDEYTQTFDLVLSSPTNATLGTSVASHNILDDDASPSMTIANQSLIEGETGIVLTALLSAASEKVIGFDYNSVDGTATTAGGDYSSISVTGKIIPAGAISTTLALNAASDSVTCEGDETYTIIISNLTDVSFAGPNPTITINDDDLPEINVASLSQNEGTTYNFNVNLSFACPSNAMSFDYYTFDLTATAGEDYTSTAGSILIPAGSTTDSFSVASNSDVVVEIDETFAIGYKNLSFTKVSSLGFPRGTILDDDAVSEVTIKVASNRDRSCAMSSQGRVKCWGTKRYLGYGGINVGDEPTENISSLPYVEVGTHDGLGVIPHTVKKVIVSAVHGCAILDDDRLKCWGGPTLGSFGSLYAGYPGQTFGILPNTMGDNLPYVNMGTHNQAGITPHKVIDIDVRGYTEVLCAVLDTGQVKCWGNTVSGNSAVLGRGTTATGIQANGDSLPYIDLGTHNGLGITPHTAKKIALSSSAACAILDDDRVKCWGNAGGFAHGNTNKLGDNPNELGDNFGYLDLGTHDAMGLIPHTAKAIVGMKNKNTFCAILDDDRLKCWGDNGNGVLGIGDTATRGDAPNELGDNLPYTDMGTHDGLGATPHRVKKISMQSDRVLCAILDDDRVKCWGYDWQSGQMLSGIVGGGSQWGDGPGEMGDNLAYAKLGTGRTAKDIIVRDYVFGHTMVIRDNDTLAAYGYNASGELGLGTATLGIGNSLAEVGDSSAIVDTGALVPQEFAVGGGPWNTEITCVIFTNGKLKCWGKGNGGLGILGDLGAIGDVPGEMGASLTDLPLPTGRTAIDIYADFNDICVLLDTFENFCFGVSFNNGNSPASKGDGIAPFSFISGADQIALKVHDGDACVLDEYFNFYCWATNTSFPTASTPIDFGYNKKVIDFDVGDTFKCVILNDNKLRCWGSNSGGRIFNGSKGDIPNPYPNMPAVDLGTVSYPVQVEVGRKNTCVLFANGQMKCFGTFPDLNPGWTWNYGSLDSHLGDNAPFINFGVGRTVNRLFKTEHKAICVEMDNLDLFCFGSSETNGMLGNQSSSNVQLPSGSYTPVDLNGDQLINLSLSETHTCALNTNNDVKCWGNGQNGALGNGNTVKIGDGIGEMGSNLLPVEIIW